MLPEGRENRSCRRCAHFRETTGWWCGLYSIEDMRMRGYTLDEASLPSPDQMSCQDTEPP